MANFTISYKDNNDELISFECDGSFSENNVFTFHLITDKMTDNAVEQINYLNG